MPEVVPAEVFDAGSFKRLTPRASIGPGKGLAVEGKDALGMFAKLPD